MKVEFIFKIFSGIKTIPIDPVEFFFKKVSVFCFFFVHYSFPSTLFITLSVGYVFFHAKSTIQTARRSELSDISY